MKEDTSYIDSTYMTLWKRPNCGEPVGGCQGVGLEGVIKCKAAGGSLEDAGTLHYDSSHGYSTVSVKMCRAGT